MDSRREPSMDEVFLQKIKGIVLQNLINENFDVEGLANEMNISRPHLNRKLQKITGKTTSQFIQKIRLDEALRLLEGEVATVSEIAYRVGFNSPNYFSKCFHKHFGIAPNEVGKKLIKKNKIPGQKINKIFRIWNWKRAYFVSFTIVLVIIILILTFLKIFLKDKFEGISDTEGKISIAVMPFDNLTGDTTLNFWQRGIPEKLINDLGNSNELSVMSSQTMFEVFESMGHSRTVSILPSLAKEAARKIKAGVYITGNYQKTKDKMYILVNLVDTESGEINWTDKVAGHLESDYLTLTDSLSYMVKNYLEIEALKQETNIDFHEAFTNSSEAFRYYIEGWNYFIAQDYKSSIQYLTKALNIDSTFTMAMLYLAWSYNKEENYAKTVEWIKRANEKIVHLPLLYQNWIKVWYANHVSKDYDEIRKYLSLLENSGMKSRLFWWDVGTFYYNACYDFNKAAECFDKILEINKEWGAWNFQPFYELGYGSYEHTYHMVGDHKKENILYETGLELFPESYKIRFNQAVCTLSQGDTVKAKRYINLFISLRKKEGGNEILIERALGKIYELAEIFDIAERHYRLALELEPDNYYSLMYLAEMLIVNDINVDEGMELNQKALSIQPNSPFRIRLQGYGYYKQGKYEEALKTLRRSDSLFVNWFDIENYLYIQEVEKALATKTNK